MRINLVINDRIYLGIVPFLATFALRVLGMTMTLSEHGNTQVSPHGRRERNYIYAFWHSQILLSVYFFRNKDTYVMVSKGRDGEFITRVIGMFGFGTTRGSTSREGFKALVGLKRKLAAGKDVVITPDGPQGPKLKAQLGAVFLAKMTGIPIAPYAFDCSKKIVFNSWDNFIVPLPFTKGVFVWGNLIHVPNNADEKILEEKRIELERELTRLTAEAVKLCGASSR